MEDQVLTLLLYTIPALVTGTIAYLFFREHMNNIALKDLREIIKFVNDNLLKENNIKRNSNLLRRIFLKEF